MDWKEYEAITKYIYETLGRERGVKIVGYGSKCKVPGKSGTTHQIDVLTSHSDGIHEYQTAIECKYCNQKINKEVIMKVAGIIKDAGINKGVVVSKLGFTKDCISVAKYENIGLVELRKIEKQDWKGQSTKPSFPIMSGLIKTFAVRRRPLITNIKIDAVDNIPIPEKFNANQMVLKLSDGKVIDLNKYFDAFKNELHDQEPQKEIKKSYEFKDSILINRITKAETPINGFTLTGMLTVKNFDQTRKFEIVDKVFMIMKSLFEKKSFSISEWGVIKEEE